jgi:hypothetical protein
MIAALVVCVGVAFIGVFTAIGLAASRSLREDRAYALEQAKRKREREILRLEVELGFRDPEEVRWQPRTGSHEERIQALTAGMKEIYEMRPRVETHSPHRARLLSDREVAQLLLRHKRGAV